MNLFSNSFENRHYGLDVIRAVSLLMILVVHCMIFVGSFYSLNDYLYFGVLAVELFFALSGFLIGTILLKVSANGLDWQTLKTFWLKRWMRTLPAYFVVIAVIMIVDQQFYWSFIIFLQNYVPEHLKEFPVSWTISLEEWFYLSFPILLFISYKLFYKKYFSSKTIFLIAILFYIIVPVLLRIMALSSSENELWDYSMRKNIFIRFDTIGYGLLIAWINYYYKNLFRTKIVKNTALVLSIVFCLLCWWLFNSSVNLFVGGLTAQNSLALFPLVNWVCIFAIIYAINFEKPRYKTFGKVMTTISITSYSLYLVHFQIFLLHLKTFETESQAWQSMFSAVVITFIVGFALNMTVEKFFLNKRNQWVK